MMCQPDLSLYHGTDQLEGEHIEIRSNTGVGSNDLTLGNGFYTSTSKEIALFYSHIMMRERLFDLGQDPEQAKTGKVYRVSLGRDLNLLRETDRLNIGAAVSEMKLAGIQMSDIKMLSLSEIASFAAVVDLTEMAGFQPMNAKEFLVKAMGYDGLSFVQKPYLPWYYEPVHIGVNWRKCWHEWATTPPATIVIYDTTKILSTDLVHDGGQSALIIPSKGLELTYRL